MQLRAKRLSLWGKGFGTSSIDYVITLNISHHIIMYVSAWNLHTSHTVVQEHELYCPFRPSVYQAQVVS